MVNWECPAGVQAGYWCSLALFRCPAGTVELRQVVYGLHIRTTIQPRPVGTIDRIQPSLRDAKYLLLLFFAGRKRPA
jgi:hypothetical protein